MIASPCDKCCFFKDKKCSHNQFFITNENCSFAPGFCQFYRSDKWSENKDKNQLIQLVYDELDFRYDLIVMYMENNTELLDIRINEIIENEKNRCNKIIICDVRKIKTEQEKIDIVEWFKKRLKSDQTIPIMLHVTLNPEEKMSETIKNINNQITQKYFCVFPYYASIKNNIPLNISKDKNYRYVFWSFVRKVRSSFIIPYGSIYGIYIDDAYKKMTTNSKTFYENVREEEISTGMLLSKQLEFYI
jgi:hypothetical protein